MIIITSSNTAINLDLCRYFGIVEGEEKKRKDNKPPKQAGIEFLLFQKRVFEPCEDAVKEFNNIVEAIKKGVSVYDMRKECK